MVFLSALCLTACNKPSRVEQYRAEKQVRDSIGLIEQQRTLAYYESQLEALMPVADSLLVLFSYEKNDKYQDHGYYVVKNERLKVKGERMRVMVRDDGQDLLVYRDGKRVTNEGMNELRNEGNEAIARAEHLQIVIRDVQELEKRIRKTNLEVQKYQKRLNKK